MATQYQQSTAVQGVLIGAMAVWGLNVTAVKLLTASFEPTVIAALRMVVACVALTVIVLWKRCGISATSSGIARSPRSEWRAPPSSCTGYQSSVLPSQPSYSVRP